MVINQDGLVFRVGKQMPLDDRPVQLVTARSLFNRVAWPGFGLLWTTLALGLALDMLGAGETWGLLMPGVFLLIGFVILLFGFRAMFWSRIVTLDADMVQVTERGTQPGTAWQEPLEAYRGVAPLTVEIQRKQRAFSMPAIVLDHDDLLRRIVLWSSLSSRGRDEACLDYADWLGLPVVEALRHKAPGNDDDGAAVQRG
jgi:hypothetical protein